VVRSMSWKKNTYSEYGKQPQESINRQIVDKADFAVAVFWTRFGTGSGKYGSGTVEEMEHIYNDGKQVFLYFLDKDIPQAKFEPEQYTKLQEFKKRHEKDSYFFTFKNKNDLENGFREQLELYFSDPANRTGINQTANVGFARPKVTDVIVPSTAWVRDDTYPQYPYRAKVEIEAVDDKIVPFVIFNVNEATSGNYAPIAKTYEGGIYLYARKKPDTIKIPTITFSR